MKHLRNSSSDGSSESDTHRDTKRTKHPEDSISRPSESLTPITTQIENSSQRRRVSLAEIIIFGDSYSRCSLNDESDGLEASDTWVNAEVDYVAGRDAMDTRSTVHNFAFPGATAEDDLNDQLTRFLDLFKRPDAKSPPPLDPEKSTYLLWLGINDCGRTAVDDLEPIVESIIDAVHVLYTRASARNFVIFQVPPINRSPSALVTDSAEEVDQRITIWNDLLRAQVLEFANNTKNANVSLFSAHEVLSEILDDPSQFDFSVNDPTDEGGAIWKDDLHLAPAVHAILAKRLLLELFSLKIE